MLVSENGWWEDKVWNPMATERVFGPHNCGLGNGEEEGRGCPL
jgi:hypothetical protein